MGNFIDNLKKITGLEPEDEIVEDYDEYEDDYVPSRAAEDYQAPSPRRANNPNVVPMSGAKSTLQVVLAKPERFDDAAAIADHLNAKRTVVLNLEAANRDVARRLIDFLSGAAYANGGQIKCAANNTFIITPYNVNVTGDAILEDIENNGMFFQS